MKTLMVSPFAPYRDGIATYALQELRRLRSEGEHVDVLSPSPSAARWHLRLGAPAGMVKLGQKAAGYERTVIQFGPELLFGGCRTASQRVAVWAALAALAKRTSLDIRIHEIEYGPLEQNPFERRAARLALDQADRVTVHTEAERSKLDHLLGLGRRIEVVPHGRDFAPTIVLSQTEARRELGLAEDGYAFVAIGFLQHHKGFDRAIEAMASLHVPGAHLHIVGSARVDHPDITGHVDQLADACARLDSATLHQRFVSDVEFDLWLQAADTIVLPYREIWSSGVIERARLFGKQIVASDLPQLRDQAPPSTLFVSDVSELSTVMEKLASSSDRKGVEWTNPPGDRGDAGLPGSDPSAPVVGRSTSLHPEWEVDEDAPDRAAVEAQVVSRARSVEMKRVGERPGSLNDRRPIDPLLALGRLQRPQPNSSRPGVAPVKRMISRLIGWQIEPLAARLEELQRATVEAVARLDLVDTGSGSNPESSTHEGDAEQHRTMTGGDPT